MERSDFERAARELSEQAPSAYPSQDHAARWLIAHGIVPTGLPKTSTFEENATLFGAIEWPTHTRQQRLDIANEWGWSDPEEIAYLAVATISSREYGSDVVQQTRTVVILQNTSQDVQIYWMTDQGRGWTTSPIEYTHASW